MLLLGKAVFPCSPPGDVANRCRADSIADSQLSQHGDQFVAFLTCRLVVDLGYFLGGQLCIVLPFSVGSQSHPGRMRIILLLRDPIQILDAVVALET